MGRISLEEKVATFIRNAIDLSVDETGYPVLGKILEETGIANRKQLRYLEKKGFIKAVTVRHNIGNKGGTHYKAYYTERLVPEWVKKQEEAHTSEA